MPYYGVRRKVFISFHHGDQTEVEDFISYWSLNENVFIPRALGTFDNDDFINSNNPEYVMSRIRQDYLGDSTVTIVLVGQCTHSRRYVDWEIKTSLRQGEYFIPNGLIGIVLPSSGRSAILPPRFADNWSNGHKNCYARYWISPSSAEQLASYIEDAFASRNNRAHLITNSSQMMRYNSKCQVCGITH
jgi:hypothetical protein